MMKLAYVLGKKYPLMKKQVKKSFIWMKVALLTICQDPVETLTRQSVAMANMMGTPKAV